MCKSECLHVLAYCDNIYLVTLVKSSLGIEIQYTCLLLCQCMLKRSMFASYLEVTCFVNPTCVSGFMLISFCVKLYCFKICGFHYVEFGPSPGISLCLSTQVPSLIYTYFSFHTLTIEFATLILPVY